MERVIKPEILDTLKPDDPAALHNRRDLRLFNLAMGNYRWMARSIRHTVHPGEPILEIGAGMGDLGFHLLSKGVAKDQMPDNHDALPALPACSYAGLDLWPRPTAWPRNWDWYQADLTSFADYHRYPVLIGNFILHQFEDAVIRDLFARIVPDLRVILFCETVRRPLHLYQLPIGNVFGMNDVSRHDARVSIEGGFYRNELPELMQLDPTEWTINVKMTLLGAYRLQAIRRE